MFHLSRCCTFTNTLENKERGKARNSESKLYTQNKGLYKKCKPFPFKKNCFKTWCIWEFTPDARINMGALRLNSCHKRVRFGTNMGIVHASGGQMLTVIPHLQQSWALFFMAGSLTGLGITDWAGLAGQLAPGSAWIHPAPRCWESLRWQASSFVTWFLRSNSGLHIYVASILHTEQSPPPNFQALFGLLSILCVWVFGLHACLCTM